MSITVYNASDDFIWIPVAKNKSEQNQPRAFLPFKGLNNKYEYGYKSRPSFAKYLTALTDIQSAYLTRDSEVFEVTKKGERVNETQYKAAWRHNETNPPLLSPTKGWIKIKFSELTSISEARIIEAIENS